MIIKCVIACHGGNGPTFVPLKVECTSEQYENGDHYEAARDWALGKYDSPMVVFDENDGPQFLFDNFKWVLGRGHYVKVEP